LSDVGYEGVWKKRPNPIADGAAIFFKKSKFQLLHRASLEFDTLISKMDDNEVSIFNRSRYFRRNVALFLLLKYKHEKESKNLCVATTHLFW
jgi:hypothetical protein